MNKISDVSSTTVPTRAIKKSAWARDGFSQALTDAMNAPDKNKQNTAQMAARDAYSFSNGSIEQLVSTSNQKNAASMANTHTSAAMMNLYMAQERKDEKSGRGREIEAVVA